MGRVITLKVHVFDASSDMWKFAKDAYGSIFLKLHFFSQSRVSFLSPNPVCIFSLVKMKAVGPSTGINFWVILKNPTVRFARKLNQCFLDRYDRMHELLVCAFIFVKKKKKVAQKLPFFIFLNPDD